MGGSFRYTVWDPWMILSQMATLQAVFYVFLGAWIFFFDSLSAVPRSLDQIFKYQVRKEDDGKKEPLETLLLISHFQSLMLSQPHGKLLITAYLCNALTW